jgi:hypothetical protein
MRQKNNKPTQAIYYLYRYQGDRVDWVNEKSNKKESKKTQKILGKNAQ